MKNKNSCKTLFRIVGDFNPDLITELLRLQPFRTQMKGEPRKDGSCYTTSSWSYGLCDEYNVYTFVQMEKTISELKSRIDVLNIIRKRLNLTYYLEIVPEIFAESIMPCLAPSLDVIDFCHETRTQLDIDLYVQNSED